MCPRCELQEKSWDIECAFKNEIFTAKNYNCATVNELRRFTYEGQDLPHWIDYQYCDDRKYATINISDLEFENDSGCPWLAVWISWYKSRGNTDSIWLLSDDSSPKRPTYRECESIIQYLKERRLSWPKNEK